MENKAPLLACDEALYASLKKSRVIFDLVELSGKIRKDVWVLSYSLTKRLVVLSEAPVKLQDVARLNFKGKSAVKFFQEVLPNLPEYEKGEFKSFIGKVFYIYPYGAPAEKWELVKNCPFYLVLHRVKSLRDRRSRKPKKVHEYSVVYKLSLSFIKPICPMREESLSEGEPIAPHEAGKWREDSREIVKLLHEEFKERKTKELPVVLALKDGREVKGVLRKKGLTSFYLILQEMENPKEKIFIFRHAVEDFWVEEIS